MRKTVAALIMVLMAVGTRAEDIAIVHNDSTLVTLKSNTQATITSLVTTTLLSEKASELLNWVYTCGPGEKLTDFRMTITNAQGKVIRDLKRGDLKQTDMSRELADDTHTYLCNPSVPTYPVDIRVQYTIQVSGGVAWLPRFVPQTVAQVPVEHASYTLLTPNGTPVKYRCYNTQAAVTEGNNSLRVVMNNLPAIVDEPWMPDLNTRIPYVLFSPQQIDYFGHLGDMSSWTNYAQWERQLLTGRDEMPEELKAKVHALTDTCTTDRSRVRMLYNYLEKTTRYVSIQLGVGGFQPMKVADVYRYGFGDCKALSHYMKALLAEVGIASNYININMHRKQLDMDFVTPILFNHVILQVPLQDETLWLECTSPSLPLGYVHKDITGNDAVAITSDGAEVLKLPVYAPEESIQESVVDVALQADGSAHLTIDQQSTQLQWEFLRGIEKLEAKKQQQFVQEMLEASNVSVESVTFTNHKDTEQALMDMKAQVSIPKYAHKMGSNLVIGLNPLHANFTQAPKNTNRQNPIALKYGYIDRETIRVALPEGYTVEALPEDVTAETPYGRFTAHAEMQGSLLVVRHELQRNPIEQPASEYAAFQSFMRTIHRAYRQQVILKAS